MAVDMLLKEYIIWATKRYKIEWCFRQLFSKVLLVDSNFYPHVCLCAL